MALNESLDYLPFYFFPTELDSVDTESLWTSYRSRTRSRKISKIVKSAWKAFPHISKFAVCDRTAHRKGDRKTAGRKKANKMR